jgi:hypothetical protein
MNGSNGALDVAAILAAQEAELAQQTVEHDGYSYTIGQLKEAFGRCVAPGRHWKDAVHMIAESQDEARLLVAAIEFHVGGPSTVTERQCSYRGGKITILVIDNAGYWSNIGS